MEVKCNKTGTYDGCKACPHNVTHAVIHSGTDNRFKCTNWSECAVINALLRVRCCNVKRNLKCWDRVK